MNDLTTTRRVSATRERKKNGRYPFHSFEDSKQESKKKKFSKGNDVFPNERHGSLRNKKASMILQGGKCLKGL